jgi:NTP pyrophosphatase (non-canonical NTP hydrolase)
MKFNEYQALAATTAIYPREGSKGVSYAALGLVGEAGEVANKVKKIIRDHEDTKQGIEEKRSTIEAELGDVLWYIAAICEEFDINMCDVAEANIVKLQSRAQRGVIGGSGDNR